MPDFNLINFNSRFCLFACRIDIACEIISSSTELHEWCHFRLPRGRARQVCIKYQIWRPISTLTNNKHFNLWCKESQLFHLILALKLKPPWQQTNLLFVCIEINQSHWDNFFLIERWSPLCSGVVLSSVAMWLSSWAKSILECIMLSKWHIREFWSLFSKFVKRVFNFFDVPVGSRNYYLSLSWNLQPSRHGYWRRLVLCVLVICVYIWKFVPVSFSDIQM